jgi:adenylate kinase family enzyme
MKLQELFQEKTVDETIHGNYKGMGYQKDKNDKFALIDHMFEKIILTTNDFEEARKEAVEWAEYDDIHVSVIEQATNETVFELDGAVDAEHWRTDNDVWDDGPAEIEEGVNDPHIFKAVFMAGGPGAGKSYVAQKLIGGTGLKTVNSDIAFTWLMNKANLRLDMPDDEKEERDQVRDRAKEIAGKQEYLYMQGRLGLLIDGTGKDIRKISAINAKLKGAGYETKMVFVNTDLETSLMRNQERAKQGDRTVDPAIAKDSWSKVQNNMMAYQQEFGKKNFYIVDNSDGPPTDERTQNFNAVWKDLHAFLNRKPENPRATAWMRQQSVSYTRPTKSNRDWKTTSRSTFDASRIADKFRKATLGTAG